MGAAARNAGDDVGCNDLAQAVQAAIALQNSSGTGCTCAPINIQVMTGTGWFNAGLALEHTGCSAAGHCVRMRLTHTRPKNGHVNANGLHPRRLHRWQRLAGEKLPLLCCPERRRRFSAGSEEEAN